MKWMLIILQIFQMGPGHFTPDFHGLEVTYYDLQLECERARHGYMETDMLGMTAGNGTYRVMVTECSPQTKLPRLSDKQGEAYYVDSASGPKAQLKSGSAPPMNEQSQPHVSRFNATSLGRSKSDMEWIFFYTHLNLTEPVSLLDRATAATIEPGMPFDTKEDCLRARERVIKDGLGHLGDVVSDCHPVVRRGTRNGWVTFESINKQSEPPRYQLICSMIDDSIPQVPVPASDCDTVFDTKKACAEGAKRVKAIASRHKRVIYPVCTFAQK
jgi:hypothetical protein